MAADRLSSADAGALAALGFLTLGPRFNDNINDIINDRIDVVCKGFMGLTVTCARCHDHKFDPIPTADYYSLRGVFASSVEPAEEPLLGAVKMTPEYTAFQKKRYELDQEMSQAQAKIRALRKGGGNAEVKELRKEIGQTRRQMAQLEANDPGSPPCANALYDSSKPENSPIFIRGEAGEPRADGAAAIPGDLERAGADAVSVWERAFGAGAVRGQPGESADAAGDRQPGVAAAFRAGVCQYAG